LPGGYRFSHDGTFYGLGVFGYWWSATEHDAPSAWYCNLFCNYPDANLYDGDKQLGFSVRCVKN
jgi:uncharacterized protein (TIGR02145 family)